MQKNTAKHSSPHTQKFITDNELHRILAAAVVLAENAAQECTRHSECAPPPFDSFEEWYAFEAALERWLACHPTRRIHRTA